MVQLELEDPYVVIYKQIHAVVDQEGKQVELMEREFHQAEHARLLAALEKAAAESGLPSEASARDALNDLLVRLRLRPAERP